MEYLQKGAILSRQYISWELKNNTKRLIQKPDKSYALTEEAARKYWRDFLLGLDYCKISKFYVM